MRLRLNVLERGVEPPSPRLVVGLRRIFRANETASFDGFLRKRGEVFVSSEAGALIKIGQAGC
jgi:hypothetical protein